ncbi:tetraacyldisaccharide 4'-kinase [Frigidibacter sp. ROC022]|uniref:tetraacyldisaccharide 4'-kinase n=1 Tax=Frigidibacter sp. ROC022 TaxID=2971796 RepID=UPI00215A838C|nr:tetraacyldisaccharide 4'-kinase [Frigidibacter sp. ROC022]MCR8724336.1 tetraacyldisaccharide 4'-kinase [Frigidibacter sp. ROC022]
MQPPRFWQNPPDAPGWKARALAPLAALTAAVTARRVARRADGYRAPVPVICVGNVHLGGTGKTPAVMALVERLLARGVKVHVVSRGYGGSEKAVLRVDPGRHDAARVGDEPLMLAAFAPVWVARDRAAGVRAAVAAGAGAVLLDDGFQNPSVIQDAAILTVDAREGFGNGRVAPAGPLREPVATALRRADLVLTLGDAEAQARFDALWSVAPLPRLAAEAKPLQTGMDWQGLAVFAFAGIGRPGKFFDTLRRLGADLRGTVALDDHQPIGDALLKRIATEAGALGAELVTTEKDAVRLPPEWRGRMLILPVRLEPVDWAPIDSLFERLGL